MIKINFFNMKRFTKKTLVIFVTISFLLMTTSCTTKIKSWSGYPLGVENVYSSSRGTLYIEEFNNGLSEENNKRYEDIMGQIHYIEDPKVQRLKEYVRSAMIADFRDSGLFKVVTDKKQADYILNGTLLEHQAIKKVNGVSMALGLVFLLPTLGLSTLLIRHDTDAKTRLKISLIDKAGSSIFSEELEADSHASSSIVANYIDVPRYHRISTLKQLIRNLIKKMESTVKS